MRFIINKVILPTKSKSNLKKLELKKLNNREKYLRKPRKRKKEKKMQLINLTPRRSYQDYLTINWFEFLNEDQENQIAKIKDIFQMVGPKH